MRHMNREGYRAPTAEKAVKNVSGQEVTRRRLINHCRSRPESYACDRCEYDAHCSQFIRDTGHVPYTCEPGEMSKEFLNKVIQIKRRKRS